MDVLQLILTVGLSAVITGAFTVWVRKSEGKTAEKNTRSTVEADAYTRAENILNGIITAQERQLSEKDALIESLKLELKKR